MISNKILCTKKQALEYCESLIPYTSHNSDCNVPLGAKTCNCGLDELIEQCRITFKPLDTKEE